MRLTTKTAALMKKQRTRGLTVPKFGASFTRIRQRKKILKKEGGKEEVNKLHSGELPKTVSARPRNLMNNHSQLSEEGVVAVADDQRHKI